MPAYSADDVIVSEASVLYAPTGTTIPDETSVAWYDNGGTFSNWTGWTLLGYTTTPTTLGYSYDLFEVDVQQSTVPIKRRKTSESLVIGTTLAQFDGDILALVLGGTNTDTAAGASQKAFSQVVAGGDTNLSEYMFAIEGYRPSNSTGTKQPVRVFVYKATINVNGDIPFDKAGTTQIPVQINALADTSKAIGQQLVRIDIVTDDASS